MMDVLKKMNGNLENVQLYAIAYLWEIWYALPLANGENVLARNLWEICYDLLLVNGENVSASPGFEPLGLRVTHKR